MLWCLDMCATSPVSGLSLEGCRPCLAADLCSASLLPRVGGARCFLCRGGGPGCEGSCVVLPSVADRGIGLAPQARLRSRADRDARLSTKGPRVCLLHTWGDREEAGATSSPGCQGSLSRGWLQHIGLTLSPPQAPSQGLLSPDFESWYLWGSVQPYPQPPCLRTSVNSYFVQCMSGPWTANMLPAVLASGRDSCTLAFRGAPAWGVMVRRLHCVDRRNPGLELPWSVC